MKKLILITLLGIWFVFSHAQIINIPADYPTIQEGIDAANNGDTVLVDTGTYIENLSFYGQSITVASHYLTTMDTSYISQTVIDGNNEGTVVTLGSVDSTTLLCGFTIINGYNNYSGGGIYCYNSSPHLSNLRISGSWANSGGGIYFYNSSPYLDDIVVSNNSASEGGGIYASESTVSLTKVNITYNTAATGGGGIRALSSSLIFDTLNRCNIYLNEATYQTDISSSSFLNLIVDTFTVLNPHEFHIYAFSWDYNILNGKLQQEDTTLFVSPDGDNNNSGFSADEPLKTIHFALAKTYVDSLNPNCIKLLNGIYSPLTNGEIFPITIPLLVNLEGESETEVILDAMSETSVMELWSSDMKLSNITITGGESDWGAGVNMGYGTPIFENVTFKENNGAGIHFYTSYPRFIDCKFIANTGSGMSFQYGAPVLKNVIFNGNYNGISHSGGFDASLTIKNSLFINNQNYAVYGNYWPLVITNTTIVNNSTSSNDAALLIWVDSAHITNCIIRNNSQSEIYGSQIITYSNIKGGYTGEGNIDEEPLFIGSGEHPFQLSNESPCIDAGTPDTSGLNMPLFDIMGNMRFIDGDGDEIITIDMGAYEFDPLAVDINDSKTLNPEQTVLCYPNPFTASTTIEYKLEAPTQVIITIFNHYGDQVQQIKMYQTQGEQQFVWKTIGLPSGVYFCTLKTNPPAGSQTKKIIKL